MKSKIILLAALAGLALTASCAGFRQYSLNIGKDGEVKVGATLNDQAVENQK